MTVWKFEVSVNDWVELEVPEGSRVLHVGTQNPRHVCFWVLCDPDKPKVRMRFRIAGTGHPLEGNLMFKGTVFDGPFVWHVFEEV